MIRRVILGFSIFILITGCSSNSPPSTTTDVCKIFKERYSWYKAAKKTEKRWKVPVYVSMAIIKQESSFVADARPGRTKLLGFIPWKRVFGPVTNPAIEASRIPLGSAVSKRAFVLNKWASFETIFSAKKMGLERQWSVIAQHADVPLIMIAKCPSALAAARLIFWMSQILPFRISISLRVVSEFPV